MGHVARLKREYRELAERLGDGPVAFPEPTDPIAREAWREILEILYTPAEAALAARMPVRPVRLQDLARRLGTPAGELRARLDPMCDRGVVMDVLLPGQDEPLYLLSPPVVGFFELSMMRAHDAIPKKRMAEALRAYSHGDPTFAREALGGDTKLGRTLVDEDALPRDQLPDVLGWERASEVVGGAEAWAVSLCFCRHVAAHAGKACEAPLEMCLSLNGGAEFVTRRAFGRAISRGEALSILEEARGRGLVQIADNVEQRVSWVCNCCGCCCEQLQAITRFGLAGVNPSGFVPGRVPDRCAGCSRCARACPVAAIEMLPVRSEGRLHNALEPEVDEGRCIGCGVCCRACRKGALAMRRSERPRVPADAVEKAVRMALERGRLAALLVDGGDSLGTRFLRKALAVLANLPPARQALATEQVRSRFVRAALSRAGR